MRLIDNLGYRLYISSSTIPNAGAGCFTGIGVAAGSPVCEYKGDIFMDDPEVKSGKKLEEVIDKPYCFDISRLKERYMYTLIGGYKTLKAEYVIAHPNFHCSVDCHPAMCESTIGFGGYVNDRRTLEGRDEKRETYGEGDENHGDMVHPELPLQERLDLGYNVYYWPLATQPLFYMIALRDIKAGEELFVDYGYNYWLAEKVREEQKAEPVPTTNPELNPLPGDIIEGLDAENQLKSRRITESAPLFNKKNKKK